MRVHVCNLGGRGLSERTGVRAPMDACVRESRSVSQSSTRPHREICWGSILEHIHWAVVIQCSLKRAFPFLSLVYESVSL